MSCPNCNRPLETGTDGVCRVCRMLIKQEDERNAALRLREARGLPADAVFDRRPARRKGGRRSRRW